MLTEVYLTNILTLWHGFCIIISGRL